MEWCKWMWIAHSITTNSKVTMAMAIWMDSERLFSAVTGATRHWEEGRERNDRTRRIA